MPLDRQTVRRIDRTGGTVLHSSRTNPQRVKAAEVPACVRAQDRSARDDGAVDCTAHALRVIDHLGLDALIPIGGEDTLSFAERLNRENVTVVAIPKTMDNDVIGTDYCIGFSTTVTRSVEMITNFRTSLGSHERIGVVELFGRHSGETSLYAAYLAAADRAIIPEVPFDIERLAAFLTADRDDNPSHYAMMTISEGAVPAGGEMVETGEADAFGHRKLGGIGQAVAEEIKRRTGVNIMFQQLGYVIRSGPPDVLDRMVAASYGTLAFDQLAAGHVADPGRAAGRQLRHVAARARHRRPAQRRRRRALRRDELPPPRARGARQADVPVLTQGGGVSPSPRRPPVIRSAPRVVRRLEGRHQSTPQGHLLPGHRPRPLPAAPAARRLREGARSCIRHAHWPLLVIAVVLECVALIGYANLFRHILRVLDIRLAYRTVLNIVLAGLAVQPPLRRRRRGRHGRQLQRAAQARRPSRSDLRGRSPPRTSSTTSCCGSCSWSPCCRSSRAAGSIPGATASQCCSSASSCGLPATVSTSTAIGPTCAVASRRSPALINRLTKRERIQADHIDEWLDSLFAGMRRMSTHRGAKRTAVVYSCVFWFFDLLCLYLVFLAFGYHVGLPALAVSYAVAYAVGTLVAHAGRSGGGRSAADHDAGELRGAPCRSDRGRARLPLINFWLPIPVGFGSYLAIR